MTEVYHDREIYATLPRNSTIESLQLCMIAGATGVRIHTAKMSPQETVQLIKLCNELSLHTMVDLPGIKVRTKDTPGMRVDTDPGEVGNRYLPLVIGEEFTLIPILFSDGLIWEKFDSDTNKCLRVSFIHSQLEVNDIVTFSDGEITCTIADILEIDGNRCLKLRINSLTKNGSLPKKGVYWNMGMSCSTEDLFSGHDHVITESDELVLKVIQEAGICHMVSEVAVSFVSLPNHLDRTVETLLEYGYDFSKTRIVAKIETIEAVDNMEAISEKIRELGKRGITVIIEIGRGDLRDDCIAKGRDLEEMQKLILETTVKYEVPVIVGTGVANSAFDKIRREEPIENLTRIERKGIIKELLCGVTGWMLAAETMITGNNAVEVIETVRRTIDEADKIVGRYMVLQDKLS